VGASRPPTHVLRSPGSNSAWPRTKLTHPANNKMVIYKAIPLTVRIRAPPVRSNGGEALHNNTVMLVGPAPPIKIWVGFPPLVHNNAAGGGHPSAFFFFEGAPTFRGGPAVILAQAPHETYYYE
jgi:hypothetical protein